MQTLEARQRPMILSYDTPRVDRIRDIGSRLLPFSDLPDLKEHDELPLCVIKRRSYFDPKHLVVIGVIHRTDPTDPQYGQLCQEFKSWRDKTGGTKRVLVVEGGIPNTGNIDTEDSAYQSERGEVALLGFWAKKHNIEIISGEPDRKNEANEVVEIFDKDTEVIAKRLTGKEVTAYYYIARQIPQWHRFPKSQQPDFQTYLEQTIARYESVLGWEEFDFSYNNFTRIHEQIYDAPFDHTDNSFFLDQTVNNPHADTLVQKVSQAVQDIRDKNLANLYAKCWDSNISVFSTYGKYHTLRMAGILNTFGLEDK